MLSGNWSYPTNVRFGAGRIREVADACSAAQIQRPLLVTDKGLAGLPMIQDILTLLQEAGITAGLYGEVAANPSDRDLDAGLAVFRQNDYDGVIAVGGGSALDLGKLLAFMAGQTRPVWDFEDVDDWWSRADATVIKPIIAVPTTAGTGSEVGRAGVLVNTETHEKKIIFHPRMLAASVICDPELTVGLPPAMTAGTGLDAFAHCVEAFSSPHFHPMSQGIALEGMRLVKDFLPAAYKDGADIEARANMMAAAMMGATAFQKGLGAIHAISHPIGAIYNTHHGTTNAICMPPVLAFNAHAIAERFEAATAYLGIANGLVGFQEFVQSFNDSFGIPTRLSEIGVARDRIDEITRMALDDPSCGGNPVAMTFDNTRALLVECIG